jgi:transcriptional antiterminator NusG
LPESPSFAPALDPHELPAQPAGPYAPPDPGPAVDSESIPLPDNPTDTPSFAPALDPHELPAQPPQSPEPEAASAPQPEFPQYPAPQQPPSAPTWESSASADPAPAATEESLTPTSVTEPVDAGGVDPASLESPPSPKPPQPPDESAESAPAPAPPSAQSTASHKWYVVHVYSGYEQKAKLSLQERIKQSGMESCFGEILIPMESVQETRAGSTRVMAKTFYPGYIFVQMTLNDEAWHVVRDTPKVTGFVGGRYPRPVPPPEIQSVVQQVEEGAAKPRPQVVFQQGDHVRVIDGAFANFTGTVEEVKPEKQKVRVLVSIFGRATPVELDYSQVEKTV